MPECPVCETPDAKGYNPGTGDTLRIDCKRCGEFDVSGTAMAMLPTALKGGLQRRSLMSHTIRRMIGFENSRPPMIVSDKLESYWPGEKLPTPGDQADQLILAAGDRQQSPDQPIQFGGYFLSAWLGTSLLSPDPRSGVTWIMGHLSAEQLLTGGWNGNSENQFVTLQLTMRGWERYADLKKVRTTSRTAFMAMKFGDTQLDQVVDQCFRPAVRRAGYELRKLTDEQPAGLIDD